MSRYAIALTGLIAAPNAWQRAPKGAGVPSHATAPNARHSDPFAPSTPLASTLGEDVERAAESRYLGFATRGPRLR